MHISICNITPYGLSLIITINNKKFVLCFCHHIPERSIIFLGIEKYLCARCFGMLTGGIIGVILLLIQQYLPPILILPFLLPLIIDGFLQSLTSYTSNNIRRFVSGFLFGLASVFTGFYIGILF